MLLCLMCVKKERRGVMEIQKSMRRLSTIDPCLFWKLFDAQITPILTYAAEVWGLHDTKQIEKVHTFAIKRFLNVPLHCSNKMIYGENWQISTVYYNICKMY